MKAGPGRLPEDLLNRIFVCLLQHFGKRNWWPAESAFEVAVGAILTQNTAWTNVETALANLKTTITLTPAGLHALDLAALESLIRPAGFFRQKARYLREFAACLLDQCEGDIAVYCSGTLEAARQRLLRLTGIGAETADSILLYAAHRPSFVVDAYTRRIFTRLGILEGKESYDAIRAMFMENLPQDAALYNEYHALLVELAKTCCLKRKPRCQPCPLLTDCPCGRQTEVGLKPGLPR